MSFTRVLRTSTVILGATAAMLTLSITTGTAAQAHTKLVSSSPADGDTVTAAPAQITLTFDEPLMQSADTISINDASGQVIASQQVQPNGAVVSVAWPANLKSGDYEIAYRVVADDGHPQMGAIHFTFAGAADSAAPSSATSAPAASSPSAAASPASTATSAESTTSTGLSTMTLGIILLAVLVVFGFVLTVRRRKRT